MIKRKNKAKIFGNKEFMEEKFFITKQKQVEEDHEKDRKEKPRSVFDDGHVLKQYDDFYGRGGG